MHASVAIVDEIEIARIYSIAIRTPLHMRSVAASLKFCRVSKVCDNVPTHIGALIPKQNGLYFAVEILTAYSSIYANDMP